MAHNPSRHAAITRKLKKSKQDQNPVNGKFTWNNCNHTNQRNSKKEATADATNNEIMVR